MKLLEISRVILLLAAVAFPISAKSQSIDEAIGILAEKLGAQLGEEGSQRLAIHGFSDLNGFESALGDFISEELTTALFGAGDFAIVERNEFERVIREHERYSSDIFNSETIADLGEFLAIDSLVTGSVTQFDDSIRINARAIDVETARVFAAAAVSVSRDGMVNTLIGQRSRLDSTDTESLPQVTTSNTDAIFENQYIRIIPTNKTLSPENNRLALTVEIFNNTNDALTIGYIKRNEMEPISSEDEALKLEVSGLGSHALNVSAPENYVTIEPQASIIATFEVRTHSRRSFKANQILISGDLTLIRMNNWRDYEYFSIQLPNISVYD